MSDSDVIEVFVEIPKGSRNKYEWDHETRRFMLDRMLFSAVQYPGDYGFLPGTWAEDGDPLDVLVILGEPTFPGCTIAARVVGVFWMTDEKGPDAKIITVPQADPRWSHVQELADVPQHLLAEIGHFFSIYKDLEGKSVKVDGFGDREDALGEVAKDRQRFADLPEADRPAVP
ncbi:MAG: inorganic diphosphatase [Egibacteraceae bacterium]